MVPPAPVVSRGIAVGIAGKVSHPLIDSLEPAIIEEVRAASFPSGGRYHAVSPSDEIFVQPRFFERFAHRARRHARSSSP
jgi:hypothetical protein